MISKKYLEQALRIRKNFNETSNELFSLGQKLNKINEEIQSTLDKLKGVNNKIEEFDNKDSFAEEINKCLIEFEIQANHATKLYTPLNEKMEELAREESELFDKLVKEYSHMRENDIILEVHSFLKESGI